MERTRRLTSGAAGRLVVLLVALGTAASCSSDATGSTPSAPASSATPATAAPATTPAPTTAGPDTSAASDSSAGPDTSTATSDGSDATDAPGSSDTPATTAVIGPDERPVTLFVPGGYDPTVPAPLVVLLHGYTASGDAQEAYFHVQAEADARGYLYLHPDGTFDALGNQFWNATDACCDFVDTGVDDVGYLEGLVAEVSEQYAVDPARVYLLGHSNGGFMSYRMACEAAGTFAAIVSLAGATYVDADDCDPSEPVSVVQIHGTADQVVAYEGGVLYDAAHPAATDTVAMWASYDDCDETLVPSTSVLDLDRTLADAETSISAYAGCAAGTAVELWTIDGGGHVPPFGPDFLPAVFDFFDSHPKG